MAANSLYRALRITDSAFTTATAQALSRRAFTNSAICMKHGAVPSFQPSSTPELETILAKVRSKVFLPQHLSGEQRKLVYASPRKSGVDLAAEPVRVTLDGEQFQLEHIDKTKDVPKLWGSVSQAVDLAETKEDYDNIFTLLIGLKDTRFEVNDIRSMKITASLVMKGRPDLVVELARRQAATGFSFRPQVFEKWIFSIQRFVWDSKLDPKTVQKALTCLEQTNDLAQDPSRKWEIPSQHLYSVLLDLSAFQATHQSGGKDADGKVANYAEKFLASPGNIKIENVSFHDQNRALKTKIVMLRACKQALPILSHNPAIAEQLKNKISELTPEVERVRKLLLSVPSENKDKQWGSIAFYDQVLSSEAV